MITASILVIVASIAMIIHNECRFGRILQISFSIIGIIVSVSLVSIFPFDFSILPNTTAVDVVPIVVTVFFILLPVFYGVTVIFLFVGLRRYNTRQQTG